MKIFAAFLAIMAIVFALVSGMSLVPNDAGIKGHKDHADCHRGGGGGGSTTTTASPTNSTG